MIIFECRPNSKARIRKISILNYSLKSVIYTQSWRRRSVPAWIATAGLISRFRFVFVEHAENPFDRSSSAFGLQIFSNNAFKLKTSNVEPTWKSSTPVIRSSKLALQVSHRHSEYRMRIRRLWCIPRLADAKPPKNLAAKLAEEVAHNKIERPR